MLTKTIQYPFKFDIIKGGYALSLSIEGVPEKKP